MEVDGMTEKSSMADRVYAVLISGWFTQMAIGHCGKDYGSDERNQYFFYRKAYHMTASEALREVRKFRRLHARHLLDNT